MTMIPPSARDSLQALVERDTRPRTVEGRRVLDNRRTRRLATSVDFGASHSGIVDLDGLGPMKPPPPLVEAVRQPAPSPSSPRRLPYAVAGMLVGAIAGAWMLALIGSPSSAPVADRLAEAPTIVAARELSVAGVDRTPTTGETTERRRVHKKAVATPKLVEDPVAVPEVVTDLVEASSPEENDVAAPKPRVTSSTAKVAAKPRTPTTTSKAKATTSTTAMPKKTIAGDLSAACILDPSTCETQPTPEPRPQAPRVTAEDLPEKPSTAQIRTALDAVRLQAKACADRHGGLGESVRVKLSIAGATGTVTQADALAPQGDSALGQCVADALAKARFPRFGAQSVGVVYPVRL